MASVNAAKLVRQSALSVTFRDYPHINKSGGAAGAGYLLPDGFNVQRTFLREWHGY